MLDNAVQLPLLGAKMRMVVLGALLVLGCAKVPAQPTYVAALPDAAAAPVADVAAPADADAAVVADVAALPDADVAAKDDAAAADLSALPDVSAEVAAPKPDIGPDIPPDPCASLACDDGNPCTVDSCAAATGCSHTPASAGTACQSSWKCDGAGTCNAVGMVLIKSDTFWMGCNAGKDYTCDLNEKPQHKVTLGSYYMDVSETTVAQYKACVDAGACAPAQDDMMYKCASGPWLYDCWSTGTEVPPTLAASPYCNWGKAGKEQHPVNCVNWTHAQQYCKWRGDAYDLPTEAQWELAARGSCQQNGSAADSPTCGAAMRTYPWGETIPDCTLAVVIAPWSGSGPIQGAGCGADSTWAVGSKPAGDSPFGIHDLAGNVWEWTRDWLAPYTPAAQLDPVNLVPGQARVQRGGGFSNKQASQRASLRSDDGPEYAAISLGFRCVRSFP